MKKLLSIIFLLSLFIPLEANEIDSIESISDIKEFLITHVDKSWSKEELWLPRNKESKKYEKNYFYKIDLDNNGETDLLIDGKYLFAVISKGGKEFTIKSIDHGAGIFMMRKYSVQNITQKNSIPLIIVQRWEATRRNDDSENHQLDTLFFVQGGFVEYNQYPNNYKILKIKYRLSKRDIDCPIYRLTLKKNGNLRYFGLRNTKRIGIFYSQVEEEKFDDLEGLVNLLNMGGLKSSYEAEWNHDAVGIIKIKYLDEDQKVKKKKIKDYGRSGSFGLLLLQTELNRLRFN